MKKIETLSLNNFKINLYSNIIKKDNIKLFIIQDGDIFISKDNNLLGRINNSLEDIVIVLIHSNNRFDEYTPWEEDNFRTSYPFTGGGDKYLSFIKNELLASLESHLDIKISKKNTFLGGASLGGLISLYGITKYPDDFGGAICISSSFWYDHFTNYLANKNNYNTEQSIYMDIGNKEGKGNITLYRDVLMETKKVYGILLDKGFKKENIYFKIQEGMSHRSSFFTDRIVDGISFLYKK